MKNDFFLCRISNDTNENNRQEVQNKTRNISIEFWNFCPQAAIEIRSFYLAKKLEVFIWLYKFVQTNPVGITDKDTSGE